LPVTKANLQNKVKIFRNLLFERRRETSPETEENSVNSDWFAVAESLRNSLIEPLKFENVNRLAIVAEGFLHDLPFAALAKADGENVRFLIEDFTIFYPPSASVLQGEISRRERRDFFSFGINRAGDLPDLKFAEEESAAVVEIFGGKSNVKNEATETAVKNSIPKANYLHFATHAVVESNMPLLSRLVFAKGETDDGNLTTREIFALGMDAELVTIAACESGFVVSNEEVTTNRVGLTEAFLHAGANSVLSSLLPVSDAASVEFMKDFYGNLKEHDKAESLTLTQRKMLQTKFKHPRFWSPFILVGSDK
jgi:CHAT domain-containing protein